MVIFKKLYQAYRYYFYRSYSFTLKNWKNKEIAYFSTNVLVSIPIMLNIGTVIAFAFILLNVKRTLSRETSMTCLVMFTIIFLSLNYYFIDRNFNKIIKEFKAGKKNKKQYLFRGWLVTLYYLGSYFLFFGLILYGINIGKKREAIEVSKHPIDIKQDSLNKARLDSFFRAGKGIPR